MIQNTELIWKGRTKPNGDIINNKEKPNRSSITESEGPLKNGTFELIVANDIIMRTFIFDSRITDNVKTFTFGDRWKGRLVAQVYSDRVAVTIATKLSTMQLINRRPVFSLQLLSGS